jgi:hypothetical protein
MGRLIEADALLKHERHAKDIAKYDGELLVVGKGFILDAPTVDAAPVVRGEWLEDDSVPGMAYCSSCKKSCAAIYNFNYCPSCGADMRSDGQGRAGVLQS